MLGQRTPVPIDQSGTTAPHPAPRPAGRRAPDIYEWVRIYSSGGFLPAPPVPPLTSGYRALLSAFGLADLEHRGPADPGASIYHDHHRHRPREPRDPRHSELRISLISALATPGSLWPAAQPIKQCCTTDTATRLSQGLFSAGGSAILCTVVVRDVAGCHCFHLLDHESDGFGLLIRGVLVLHEQPFDG